MSCPRPGDSIEATPGTAERVWSLSLLHRFAAGGKFRVRRVTHHPPISQLDGAGTVSGVGFRVCHLHDGGPLLVEFAEQFHDLPSLSGMQVSGWLIRQQ